MQHDKENVGVDSELDGRGPGDEGSEGEGDVAVTAAEAAAAAAAKAKRKEFKRKQLEHLRQVGAGTTCCVGGARLRQ